MQDLKENQRDNDNLEKTGKALRFRCYWWEWTADKRSNGVITLIQNKNWIIMSFNFSNKAKILKCMFNNIKWMKFSFNCKGFMVFIFKINICDLFAKYIIE